MLKTARAQARTTANNFRADYSEPRQRAEHTQLDALTRSDLLAIAQGRFGTASSLPNDDEGRRFLRAYLLKGMPATQALDLASWSREDGEFFAIVASVEAERRKPNADRLGNLIEFSFEELKALKRKGIRIKFVAPFDAQRWQVDAFWKAERQEADRERKQRERNRRKESTMPMSKRAKQVHKVLRDNHWTSVSDIMEAVELRDQRKRKLAPHALRVAVHRALDELVAGGLAEKKTEIEQGVATRFVRRAHVCGQNSVIDNTVTDHRKSSAQVGSQ
jgi:hypothetical protein